MTKRFSIVIAAFAVALLGPREARCQLARAYILQDSVTVGDRITLVVVAERRQDATVAFPTFDPVPGQAGGLLGDLVVFGPRSQGRSLLGVGHDYPVADTMTYEVTTFALDSAFVPQITVRVTAGGQERRVASAPFFFPVTSLVPDNATALRDITPIATFPRNLLRILGVLLVALAIAGLLRWWWKRPARPEPVSPAPLVAKPVESPIAEATRRLKLLESAPLSTPDEAKTFFVELSDTLRTYIERKTDVKALEMTTVELHRALVGLTQESRLQLDIADDVRTVLQQSDLAKFAKRRYPETEARAMVGETRVLLLRVEDQYRTQQSAREGTERTHVHDDEGTSAVLE